MAAWHRFLCAFVLFWPILTAGQSNPNSQSNDELIRNLLNLRAPAPPAGTPTEQVPQNNVFRAPTFSEPPADAPLDVLGRYWGEMSSSHDLKPSAIVSRKLLEFCDAQPAFLPELLARLPEDQDAIQRIKIIYDKNASSMGDEWRKKVRQHLQSHGDFFRDDLFAEAQAAQDDNKAGDVAHSEELTSLAELDWPRAEPLLKKLVSNGAPRTALLAETLMYRHFATIGDEAAASALRVQLKHVVENRKALGYCRETAAFALFQTEWKGRDDWYFSLFHDPSLRELHDGYYLRRPLSDPVYRNPDHWIPVVARLVNDPDRAVHDAAVSCLIGFHLDSGRKDALEPLLPWLMDPKWSAAEDRLRLIQTVDRLEMRESIPGLIAVLKENGDSYDRSYAAESLAHFRDPRAIPALRIALRREKEAAHRQRIIKALVVCGGVSAAEGAKTVEAFAEYTRTPENKQKWEDYQYSFGKIDVPAEVALGGYLARNGPENDETVELLVKRVEELKSKQPALATSLQSLIAEWPSRSSDRAVIRHIRNSSVTAEALAAALERRESLRKNVDSDLHELEAMRGMASGFAAVLLADQPRELAILTNHDELAAIAGLLAAGRLVREPLPIAELHQLENSKDALLDRALDAYLEANDSPEARKFYLERHKGEARILGARQGFDPGHHSFSDFDRLEEELRDEIRKSETRNQIYALLSAGYWGSAGQIIIHASAADAEIMYVEDPARYYSRKLTSAEWQQFQGFLNENHVEDQGPLNLAAWDGMQYEYIHLTQDGGRRVFMNNPGLGGSGGSAYDRVCALFRELVDAAPLELHYRSAEKIAGFEVLLADPRVSALSPWIDGSDFRLLLSVSSAVAGPSRHGKWSLDVDAKRGELRWVGLRNDRLSAADQPAAFPEDNPEKLVPEEIEKERKESGRSYPVWPLTVAGKTYRLTEWKDHSGLWQFAPGQQPKLIAEGEFGWPVITSDGKWILLAQIKKTWAEPNLLVRIDLTNGKMSKVEIPEADKITPLTYVKARGRILITRFQEEHSDQRKPVGPATPEFWLVDPSTGKAELVHGEFTPLEDPGHRELQPSANKDRVWAAIYRKTQEATEIGLYNPTEFAFTPVLSIPGLEFGSYQMSIDEANHKAYIAYKGHLLRISMP